MKRSRRMRLYGSTGAGNADSDHGCRAWLDRGSKELICRRGRMWFGTSSLALHYFFVTVGTANLGPPSFDLDYTYSVVTNNKASGSSLDCFYFLDVLLRIRVHTQVCAWQGSHNTMPWWFLGSLTYFVWGMLGCCSLSWSLDDSLPDNYVADNVHLMYNKSNNKCVW